MIAYLIRIRQIACLLNSFKLDSLFPLNFLLHGFSIRTKDVPVRLIKLKAASYVEKGTHSYALRCAAALAPPRRFRSRSEGVVHPGSLQRNQVEGDVENWIIACE